MMDILFGWLVFPGIAFQIILALVTAWVESALTGLFGFRKPSNPVQFILRWIKGFAKRPMPIQVHSTWVRDILVIIASGWLGMAVFSKQGIPFDIPLIVLVLSLETPITRPLSPSTWIPPILWIAGFSIPGLLPGASFCLADVMQFQENYGPVTGTPAGALAALATWIGMAFSLFQSNGNSGPYPGPITVLAFHLRRSGFLWIWTACFVGGSWHGLSGLRMLAVWSAMILSFVFIHRLPRLRERFQRQLMGAAGVLVVIAALLAWGERGR